MVEIAKMTIKGSIDTKDIDRGFSRLKQGFNNIESLTDSNFANFKRLGGVVSGLARGFVKIGSVGVAALVGLAAVSPAVAGDIAKMKVGMIQLSNVAGQQLKPVFEEVANNLIPSFTDALSKNNDKINLWVDVAKTGIGAVSALIRSELAPAIISMASLGSIGAGLGAIAGGAAGAAGGAGIGVGLAGGAGQFSAELGLLQSGEPARGFVDIGGSGVPGIGTGGISVFRALAHIFHFFIKDETEKNMLLYTPATVGGT